MAEVAGRLWDDAMEKTEFATVHKNSDNEKKNVEEEVWKLFEGGTEKLDFCSKSSSITISFVGILTEDFSETQLKMLNEEYRPKTSSQILPDDFLKASGQLLRPTNSILWNLVDEGFHCYDGMSNSREKLFHPNQVKLLACQKDQEQMQKGTGERNRFRLKIVIWMPPIAPISENRHIYNIDLKPSNKQFNRLDSLEKLCHPDQVKLLGSQKDMELRPEDTWKKNRFRLGARLSLNKIFAPIREAINLICLVSNQEMYRDLESSYKQFDEHSIAKVSAMDSADFTALDISSVSPPFGKTDVEMKLTQLELGAWREKDETEKAFQWWHKLSHLKNTWPISKTENEYSHIHGLQLLLLLTLLSIITFLTALKIMGCKSEEGYKNNYSLNPICLIVNQYPDFIQLVIAFNTLAFLLSIAWMLIIFNKLPLRPLLLVSSFSMLGAYMCVIAGPSKPPLGHSTQIFMIGRR